MTLKPLPEAYVLESIEQMRAIADELRQRIFQELLQEPRTVTQVADSIGVAPARVHYHVRELERVGLVNQVFTREKGGILEKYFRPVARNLTVDQHLLQRTPREEYMDLTSRVLADLQRGFLDALSRAVEQAQEHTVMALRLNQIWVTPDEFAQLQRDLETIEQRYSQRRVIEGERAVKFAVVANEPGPLPAGEALTNEGAGGGLDAPHVFAGSKDATTHKTWAAGSFTWHASDLEGVLARGKTLDITVLGLCAFADDVTPELADRAVSRLTVHGKLAASPDVRTVLQSKKKESRSTFP